LVLSTNIPSKPTNTPITPSAPNICPTSIPSQHLSQEPIFILPSFSPSSISNISTGLSKTSAGNIFQAIPYLLYIIAGGGGFVVIVICVCVVYYYRKHRQNGSAVANWMMSDERSNHFLTTERTQIYDRRSKRVDVFNYDDIMFDNQNNNKETTAYENIHRLYKLKKVDSKRPVYNSRDSESSYF
jgi:hypothetical protein